MQETARRKVLLQGGQDVLQRLLLQVTSGGAYLSNRLGFYLRKPVKSTLQIELMALVCDFSTIQIVLMALKLISHNPNSPHGSGVKYTEPCILLLGLCEIDFRAMSIIWIVLKSQTRAMSTIWSVLFSQTRAVCSVYYLEHLFYSALKSEDQ